MTRNAAIWTMVRNEDFFLQRWVDYYSQFVPREHLYILVDGSDSRLPNDLSGCQIVNLPRSRPGRKWDKERWGFLSHFAGALTFRYDVVIGGDVDELIVLDPDLGTDPIAYITSQTEAPVISPFAIEVIHRVDLEDPLRPGTPILEQRRYARPNGAYCKPCIIRKPVKWSLGQHYSNHPKLHLSEALFLFHLRYVDRDILIERQQQRFAHVSSSSESVVNGVAGQGWSLTGEEIDSRLGEFSRAGEPSDTDFLFKEQRLASKNRWSYEKKRDLWRHARYAGFQTYKIPDRFKTVF